MTDELVHYYVDVWIPLKVWDGSERVGHLYGNTIRPGCPRCYVYFILEWKIVLLMYSVPIGSEENSQNKSV